MFFTAKAVQLCEMISRRTRHVENEPHVWRQTTSVSPDNVLKNGELIRANRQITVLELSQKVGIRVGKVEEILQSKLKVCQVSEAPEHRERPLVAVTQLL
jgi:hypothetical protein